MKRPPRDLAEGDFGFVVCKVYFFIDLDGDLSFANWCNGKQSSYFEIILSYYFVIVKLVCYFFKFQSVLFCIFYSRTAFGSFNDNIGAVFKHVTSKINTFTKCNTVKH